MAFRIDLADEKRIRELERKIGYDFKNPNLLRQALMHTSFSNEHHLGKLENNERLEFLGDAVLELVSSDYLFHNYSNYPEGKLTRLRASLVCEQTLALCAREIPLGDFLYLGKGEDATGGRDRDSIVSDAMEAVIGAIYLDGGMEPAKHYVMRHILKDLKKEELFKDYKTIFQEEYIKLFPKCVISYDILSESGPEHEKVFEAAVIANGEELARGTGHSKKSAHQNAALEALKKIGKMP